ncbi:hypothetical protein TVAG_349940 [Trichomonas vaginalis G3]|uniref:Uncharacterized protein n=1 Tax=Trichomonas vaginalis (strain ATCC PRA-98 / G3) TaxID=412133 RepID=A2FR17_TRIV3|nr:galactose-binding domain-like family [Trichomonas vaginalis G3]EAX92647.1 hypothetical protein TVAG_349940 [Trichomonas vaginalis G3]KAI5535697.1 galactose-binding domain-like family [Trichomonas vaginalis G3]|eukprot:XP_001305577.1 hypothetical protein [Trichomonas vaginalis G3]
MSNNGYAHDEIDCTSASMKPDYPCVNSLYWNSSNAFAANSSGTNTYILSFLKTFVNVEKIQIKDGDRLTFLSSSVIDSSLDGSNYKFIMETNDPFCDRSEHAPACDCDTETIREYKFPQPVTLKHLRISGKGLTSCGSTELSFYAIEIFGTFSSYCNCISIRYTQCSYFISFTLILISP